MNKNSLLYKIITNFTTILAVILVSASIFLTFAYRNYFYKDKMKMISRESDILVEDILEGLKDNTSDITILQDKIDEFNLLSDVGVAILDNKGLLFASSSDNVETIGGTKVTIEEKYLSKLKNGETVEYGEIGEEPNRVEAYLKPIMNEGSYSGTIVMTLSQEEVNDTLFIGYKVIWISTLVSLVIALISINFFTKRQLINPLKEIYLVANKLARGEVNQRIQVKSSDEIGELAKSFNLMAESLEAVDSNRRDFISNVSHELRSPITSMKGFIAGMLDGVISKDKEND